MPVPAERTLSPDKPVTERWQIFGLLVPLVVLGLGPRRPGLRAA